MTIRDRSFPRPAHRSLWSLIDPRARLFCVLSISAIALSSSDLGEFLLVYSPLAVCYVISRTGVKTAWRGFRPFAVLIVLTAVLQLFFTEGTPYSEGVPFLSRITREGVASSFLILSRLSAVILLSTLLVATTSPHDLSRSLGWFISPLARLRVPVGDLMLIMNLAFQFFPLLTEETKNVRMGLESRGISLSHPKLGLRLRATAAWMLAVMTAVLERSHRTAAALQIKEGGRGRTLKFRFAEWSMAGTTCIVLTLATVALWFLVDGSHSP